MTIVSSTYGAQISLKPTRPMGASKYSAIAIRGSRGVELPAKELNGV